MFKFRLDTAEDSEGEFETLATNRRALLASGSK